MVCIDNGLYLKSLPFLENGPHESVVHHPEDHHYAHMGQPHPITKSSTRFMLSDEFHKRNTSIAADKLRVISLVQIHKMLQLPLLNSIRTW